MMGKMMLNLQGALLAKAFLPEPEDIKNCLKTLDLTIKFQVLLFEFSSICFWSTLAELFLFWFSFVLFCTDAEHMGMAWLHLFHVVRGLCSLLILIKLPNSHDLLNEVHID